MPEQTPSDILKYFSYSHLQSDAMREMSKGFHDLAVKVDALPPGAEKSTALRKLLEGKDAAVRAVME